MADNNLEYAFTWLTGEGNKIFDLVQQQVQAANPILGAIEFEIYDCTKGTMPQKYQSAWSAIEGIVGASYTPCMTVGKQQAKGTNYWFIAEQTLITKTPIGDKRVRRKLYTGQRLNRENILVGKRQRAALKGRLFCFLLWRKESWN